LQFSQKLGLADNEFHRLVMTSKQSGLPAVKEPDRGVGGSTPLK
jgi:hypothetical protein